MNIDDRLKDFLSKRVAENIFRSLQKNDDLIDFTSNDYLGLAKSAWIKQQISFAINSTYKFHKIGATGSRLLEGNCTLYDELEKNIAKHHHAETSLIFNSGYNANVGLVSTVANKNDVIFYDEYVHASIHQGIKLSGANAIAFKHNDVDDLEHKIQEHHDTKIKFIITESLFSMDGDIAELNKISNISKMYNCNLIVDEAHATGIFGEKGSGLCNYFGIEQDCFARVYTYGKALGTHGAAILGSSTLKNYLINFSKPFIYSTALNIYDLLSIQYAYEYISEFHAPKNKLFDNIQYFNNLMCDATLYSESPIFSYIVPSSDACKLLSIKLREHGVNAKAIVYPTVPKGKERIRIIMHSYNSKSEIEKLAKILNAK
ncbi:MAG: pyridoxal phosphate-dependent aminotransferase family protein [Sphingobacteriales bacterium]|nr:MAG: pyridoxal phosphate-dependent aminotransferase family protein [Sphingobacteriales bacterium]